MPVFHNIPSAKRTGENGLLGIEWRQSAGLSLEGASAVRFQEETAAVLDREVQNRGLALAS